jgi:hypothetical protein
LKNLLDIAVLEHIEVHESLKVENIGSGNLSSLFSTYLRFRVRTLASQLLSLAGVDFV